MDVGMLPVADEHTATLNGRTKKCGESAPIHFRAPRFTYVDAKLWLEWQRERIKHGKIEHYRNGKLTK